MWKIFLVAQIVLPTWSFTAQVCLHTEPDYLGWQRCVGFEGLFEDLADYSVSSVSVDGLARSIVWALPGYGKDCRNINESISNLAAIGFDDVATFSVYPFDGVCFFADVDEGGDDFCVPAGQELETLPTGWDKRISSIKIFGLGQTTVFKDVNFGGDSLLITDDVRSLAPFWSTTPDFDNAISSVKVSARDGACFYDHAGFAGSSFCLEVGSDLSLESKPMDDKISSIRISGKANALVFEDHDFLGSYTSLQESVWLEAPWNDAISSVGVSAFLGTVQHACT